MRSYTEKIQVMVTPELKRAIERHVCRWGTTASAYLRGLALQDLANEMCKEEPAFQKREDIE
jgi:hypothetical protein